MRVATDGLAQGQTMLDRKSFIDYPQGGWGKELPLTQVCMQVDAPACNTAFEDAMMGNWLAHANPAKASR